MRAITQALRTGPHHPSLVGMWEGVWERRAARLWAALRSLRRLAAMPGPAEHDISRPAAPTFPGALGARASAAADQPFSDLFLRERLPLTEYLYGMTRDREWAADLVQDTFVRAFAARQDLAGIAQPRAWLFRIATNLTLNALRRQRRFIWLPLGHVEPEAGPDDSAARAARPVLPPLALPAEDVAVSVTERDAVWSVLRELPPRWRAVLLLQTTSGFAVDEIAALLQLSAPNVRKMLFRAKERFRATYTRLSATGGQA